MKAECRSKEKQQDDAGLVAGEEDAGYLFMASNAAETQPNSVWLVDSGCSNHMTGDRTLFSSLDESLKINVRLGDNKEMKVLGIGVVTVHTQGGDQKKLHDVQYVPGLAHNLLSVG
ncbi:RNA-directed DNA polymerase protein [Dioscorea alata]|uniref:RNA-directed DNA polymerase protein n=1 Tax=Dioscorea alata TaxID=55571 RepID=A0ACB7U5E6_DIOAL|nr:RNA-directed DNA polymerase protein [Dioscorea alata]